MNLWLLVSTLLILASCSSTQERENLSARIEAEEIRSFKEIKSHTDLILNAHPELSNDTKNEIRALLDSAMKRHNELKDQESIIFQLLLEKSLKVSQLTKQELKDKKNLKIRLSEVYDEKYKNVLSLIKKIVELSNLNIISDDFRKEMLSIMRDFR